MTLTLGQAREERKGGGGGCDDILRCDFCWSGGVGGKGVNPSNLIPNLCVSPYCLTPIGLGVGVGAG